MASLWEVKDVFAKVKAAVFNYTEFEAKVHEATNNNPWGASSSLMQDIAQGTSSYQHFNEIMPTIYKRFTDKQPAEWRQIYKSLTLLEYLIKNGSERVIDDSRQKLSLIKSLKSFHYIDENGKDQGINVRKRSGEIVELLSNTDLIKTERSKAKTNRSKYQGMSSSSGGFGSTSIPTTSSRYGGFSSEEFFSQSKDDSPKRSSWATRKEQQEQKEQKEKEKEREKVKVKVVEDRSPPKRETVSLLDFEDAEQLPVSKPLNNRATNDDIFGDDFGEFASAESKSSKLKDNSMLEPSNDNVDLFGDFTSSSQPVTKGSKNNDMMDLFSMDIVETHKMPMTNFGEKKPILQNLQHNALSQHSVPSQHMPPKAPLTNVSLDDFWKSNVDMFSLGNNNSTMSAGFSAGGTLTSPSLKKSSGGKFSY